MQPVPSKRQARRRSVRRRRGTFAAALILVVVVVIAGVLSQSHHHAARNTLVSQATPTPSSTSPAAPLTARARAAAHDPYERTATATTTRRQTNITRHKHTPAEGFGPSGCTLDLAGARRVVHAEQLVGYHVGFAVTTSNGRALADMSANIENNGASITKAMLLVAYLHDDPVAVSPAARQELTAMIEVSDNTAANWVYDHLSDGPVDVERVASDTHMTGFHLDLSDPVYTLGQSLITARGFAGLFANIQSLMPARERRFGMGLLARVQERVGLLDAGLPGVVYSKEGWKPETGGALGAPYIVNQAAQFSCGGVRYGIAVTVGHSSDQASGENVVQHIASAMMR